MKCWSGKAGHDVEGGWNMLETEGGTTAGERVAHAAEGDVECYS